MQTSVFQDWDKLCGFFNSMAIFDMHLQKNQSIKSPSCSISWLSGFRYAQQRALCP